jgi:hypothetical protein
METRTLIARYHTGFDVVVAALDGITAEELDRTIPGEWSARQIVHHLADSETRSFLRLRQVLAEEDARIDAYDENLWAKQSWYGAPIDLSLAVLRAVREATGQLIETLSEEQWLKSGTHSESGPFGATTWLEWYSDHPHAHADQILRARQGYPQG